MDGARNEGGSRASIEPGARIASYQVVRLIGQGGMSEVYEAIQIGTSRPIALKLLGGRRAEDPRYVERLRREGYALARIRHPNVVVVYDAGVAEGQAWIAMDLLEGLSLRDLLLEQGRLPLPQALSYASAIFDGLEAAHRLGIIHRDMKPENVFLTRDGGLKIVDFGNAKLLNSDLKSTDPHKVFGTAAYMSPEQLGFHRAVGPRTDLYAVGLMLYEMLRGRHPFADGPSPYDLPPSIELCRMQIEELPPPLATVEPKIPVFISDFVSSLFAKDPAQRPSSAFLAAREVRDMNDLIFREAKSAGLTPGRVGLSSLRPPRPRPLDRGAIIRSSSQPEFSRSVVPAESQSSATQSTTMAVAVGAIVGTLLFAIASVSRFGAPVIPRHVASPRSSSAPPVENAVAPPPVVVAAPEPAPSVPSPATLAIAEPGPTGIAAASAAAVAKIPVAAVAPATPREPVPLAKAPKSAAAKAVVAMPSVATAVSASPKPKTGHGSETGSDSYAPIY